MRLLRRSYEIKLYIVNRQIVNYIMIQRIQTVYLMLIVALGILLYFAPVIELTTPADAATQRMYEIGADGIDEITPGIDTSLMGEPLELDGLWGLSLTTLLISLLALIDISTSCPGASSCASSSRLPLRS